MDSVGVECAGEYVGRLSHGADALKELVDFAVKNGITSGVFTLIGAVKSVRLEFYDQAKKGYLYKDYNIPLEMVSCTGNLASKDGVLFAHAHGCFARRDGLVVGGHVSSMVVFAGEFHLRAFRGRIERKFDPATGLYLMDLKPSE